MSPRGMAACAALLALTGCAGGPSPRTHYYVLSVAEGASAAERTADGAAAALTRVAVARVAIPGVVDRPQIVARVAANSVEIYDFHRWAEPLQEAIPRVLAGNLARQLGTGYAVTVGALPGLPPDLRVAVDVQKLDASLGGTVAIEALWSVRPGAGEARTGRSVVEERVVEAGHAGIAAACSRALAALARDIAAAAAGMPVSRPR